MKAIMTVGVSGSGKSSLAASYDDYYRIERDLIRFTKLRNQYTGWKGRKPYKMIQENEAMVNRIQDAEIKICAANRANIILSDTWLDKKHRRAMYAKLKSLGYEIKVVVVEVPLLEVIERDSYRGNLSVGEEVIRRQWDKFQGAKAQLIGEVDKYGIELVRFENFGDYIGKEKL